MNRQTDATAPWQGRSMGLNRLRSALAGLVVVMVLMSCVKIGPAATPGLRSPSVTAGQPSGPPGTSAGLRAGYGNTRADWVGVWRGREPDISGYSDTVTVLDADGTFSTQSMNLEFGSVVTIWGQWDVSNLSGTPFLRFAVEGHEPSEWCGPVQCSAIIVPTGAARHFRFITTDEVLLRDQDCTASYCEVLSTRST